MIETLWLIRHVRCVRIREVLIPGWGYEWHYVWPWPRPVDEEPVEGEPYVPWEPPRWSQFIFEETLMDNEYRVVIVYVPERAMITYLNWRNAEEGSCLAITGVDIPEDAVVIRCWHEHSKRAFGFMLRHESFPEVKEGYEPPVLSQLNQSIKVIHKAVKLQEV